MIFQVREPVWVGADVTLTLYCPLLDLLVHHPPWLFQWHPFLGVSCCGPLRPRWLAAYKDGQEDDHEEGGEGVADQDPGDLHNAEGGTVETTACCFPIVTKGMTD